VADPADAAHLLRRTEFVAKPARITALSAMTRAQMVDDVMDLSLNANPQLPDYLTTDDDAHRWDQYVFAYEWWVTQMLTRPRPFQERMTLFWHGHFTSGLWDGVNRVDLMMRQNQLYRSTAIGNFRTLAHQMAIEPAMLLYLSGADNVYDKNDPSTNPNENFARELMELFTLGVGNYSQSDVYAAAQAWTGHNYDDFTGEYVFRAKYHDPRPKTFFGTTKNWNGPDIIDEILRDNAGKKAIAARYIALKVWLHFAGPAPTAGTLNTLASAFLTSDLDIATLMRTMFNLDEFYSPAVKQGLVRSPIEYSLELIFRTGIPVSDAGLPWRGDQMGQSLYNPPNVAGWKTNSYWLNTSTLSARANAARDATWRLRDNNGFDELAAMTPQQAVDHVAQFFGLTLSASTNSALVAEYAYERSVPDLGWWAATNLLTLVMQSPELNMA
jgi:uncharacterized protein (DUF1800 family)